MFGIARTDAPQGLPRPLVVPARRDRAVLLRDPRRDRDVPDVLLRPAAGARDYDGPYQPLRGREVSAAYDSVMAISFEVRAGLLMRQIHHWTALIFIAVVVAPPGRVFFTGAFRRPRELNWLVGFTLLVLAMAEGFTGYSLPDDLLSGTGRRIAYSVALSIPFAGRGSRRSCSAASSRRPP
jgi:hypothetical protein